MSLPPDPADRPLTATLFGRLARVAVVNVLVFVCIAALLGGDALNALRDPAAEGAWVLKGPGAGELVEVTPAVWVYSAVHGSLTLGLVLLVLILGLVRIARR